MPLVAVCLPVGSRGGIRDIRLRGAPHKFDYWVSAPLGVIEIMKVAAAGTLVSHVFSKSSKKSRTLAARRSWTKGACSSCSIWETI